MCIGATQTAEATQTCPCSCPGFGARWPTRLLMPMVAFQQPLKSLSSEPCKKKSPSLGTSRASTGLSHGEDLGMRYLRLRNLSGKMLFLSGNTRHCWMLPPALRALAKQLLIVQTNFGEKTSKPHPKHLPNGANKFSRNKKNVPTPQVWDWKGGGSQPSEVGFQSGKASSWECDGETAFPPSRWGVGGLWRGVLSEEGPWRKIYVSDLCIDPPAPFQYGKINPCRCLERRRLPGSPGARVVGGFPAQVCVF